MWSTRRDLERHKNDVVDKEWNTERWDSKGRDIRERTVEATFLHHVNRDVAKGRR
jgi:hypothetical protein